MHPSDHRFTAFHTKKLFAVFAFTKAFPWTSWRAYSSPQTPSCNCFWLGQKLMCPYFSCIISCLLFHERGSWWQPSISLAFTSIPDSLQILIMVFSKSSLQMLFGMPDNSTLFLQLYCSPFTWFFSKFIIFSCNLVFTFFVITSSLVSFLFSNEIWSIASVSLYIWSDSLWKSISTITFPFRSNI